MQTKLKKSLGRMALRGRTSSRFVAFGSGAAQAARCLEYPIQYHPNVELISNDDVVRIEFQMDWVGLRSRAVNTEENRWLAPMRLTGMRLTGDRNRWLAPMRLTGRRVTGLRLVGRCWV